MSIQEDPSAQLSAASVADVTAGVQPGYIEGGRSRNAGRGWEWISDGYRYFRRSAGLWILLTVIFFALVVAFQVIPLVGWIAMTLLVPVFVGGLMAGCQTIERGGELELAHLFAGFRRNTGQLMLVGLIGFALTAAVMVPTMIVVGVGSFAAMVMGTGTPAPAFGLGTMLVLLIAVALMIPVNMALWFAPALAMFQNHSAPRAVGQSFKGCLRNMVPFLIYGVALFVLGLLASIAFGLGWLILAPVIFGSVYAAYRDIYFER